MNRGMWDVSDGERWGRMGNDGRRKEAWGRGREGKGRSRGMGWDGKEGGRAWEGKEETGKVGRGRERWGERSKEGAGHRWKGVGVWETPLVL